MNFFNANTSFITSKMVELIRKTIQTMIFNDLFVTRFYEK